MFGIGKLREQAKNLRVDVDNAHERIDRVHTRIGKELDVQNTCNKHLTDQIEELRKQVKQLVRLTDCTITTPTEAKPGGDVKKLTPEEIASRDRYNAIFGSSTLFFNPFRMGGPLSPLPETVLKKTVKKKKTTKK